MAVDEGVPRDLGRLRGGSRLRWRIYGALVAFGCVPCAAALVVSSSGIVTFGALVAIAATFISAYFVSGVLMAPIDELRRRLALKNYGETDAPDRQTPEALSIHDDGLTAATKVIAHVSRRGPRVAVLPRELSEIERLARSGRVSDIAIRSVSKDLFRHLSHQLKTPLALLRSHAAAARERMSGGDIEAAAERMTRIEEVSMGAAALVEKMLSLTYVTGLENDGIPAVPVNLSLWLSRMVNLRTEIGADKQIQIGTKIEAGLWVAGDAQLIMEMVGALLDNAVRYSPPGASVFLEVGRLEGAQAICVRVTDSGPGIPHAERQRVFEPFYGSIGRDEHGNMLYGTRRHRALSAGVDKASHGLGLSLVRSIAKLHGADVKLESGPNREGLSARLLFSAIAPPTSLALAHERGGERGGSAGAE